MIVFRHAPPSECAAFSSARKTGSSVQRLSHFVFHTYDGDRGGLERASLRPALFDRGSPHRPHRPAYRLVLFQNLHVSVVGLVAHFMPSAHLHTDQNVFVSLDLRDTTSINTTDSPEHVQTGGNFVTSCFKPFKLKLIMTSFLRLMLISVCATSVGGGWNLKSCPLQTDLCWLFESI